MAALNVSIRNLLIQRGERDDKYNVTLRKYYDVLEEAQLNLGWSKVYVQTDGTVSNFQLSPGLYAIAATSLLVLTSRQTDIVTGFRGRSLRRTKVDTDAAVAFDALLGKVLSARATSSDADILAGQEQVSGQLSQLEQSTRWVRDVQRIRIHVALSGLLDAPSPTGVRATIQLYDSEGMFARTFAGAQTHLVSWLHYVH